MQPAQSFVYEEPQWCRQHRPARRADSVLGEGDAAGMKMVPRSEVVCRLHRPYTIYGISNLLGHYCEKT
jgi:hypothetical protein